MPAGNMTGPQGFGPLTGRGFGPCGRGMSLRQGCCRGLGRYFGWGAPVTKEEQIKDFEAYRQALHEELEDTDEALKSLKKAE